MDYQKCICEVILKSILHSVKPCLHVNVYQNSYKSFVDWIDKYMYMYLIYLLFQFVLFLLLDIFRIFAKEGPNGVSLVRNLHLKECHAIKTQKSCVCVCTYVHASLTLVKRWINQTSDFFFTCSSYAQAYIIMVLKIKSISLTCSRSSFFLLSSSIVASYSICIASLLLKTA